MFPSSYTVLCPDTSIKSAPDKKIKITLEFSKGLHVTISVDSKLCRELRWRAKHLIEVLRAVMSEAVLKDLV